MPLGRPNCVSSLGMSFAMSGCCPSDVLTAIEPVTHSKVICLSVTVIVTRVFSLPLPFGIEASIRLASLRSMRAVKSSDAFSSAYSEKMAR